MYLNLNNMCFFEGRLTKDPEYSTINTSNGSFRKARFSIAAQKTNPKEAEFIDFECSGPDVDFLEKHFKKGTPIKIMSIYRKFQYTKDGETKYGHTFDVVKLTFVTNKNQNSSNEQQDQQQNYQQQNYQQQDNSGLDHNTIPIDDSDDPF